MIAFASPYFFPRLFFFFFLFPLLIKLSLFRPTSFLTSVLPVLSPILWGGEGSK